MVVWVRFKKWINLRIVKYCFCLLIPFVLLPLALSPDKELRCAYVILFVALYWLTEPVPIAATALLPVVLFPMLGVMDSKKVTPCYMKDSAMLFIGGLIVAVAVEDSHLHERIAMKVLLLIGTELKWLMMGFMLVTMFLSMWISNTATTAMMVPIVLAMVDEITPAIDNIPVENVNGIEIPMEDMEEKNQKSNDVNHDREANQQSLSSSLPVLSSDASLDAKTVTSSESSKKRLERQESRKSLPSSQSQVSRSMSTSLLLSVCYSANIGGTGTLTGTGPNLVLKGLMDELHPDNNEITFASWMMYNVPGMVLCVMFGWFYLYLVYIRCSKNRDTMKTGENARNLIMAKYKALGPIRFQELCILVLFVTLVLLWIFRDPKIIPGWAGLIHSSPKMISDAVPAIAIAFLLFLMPANPRSFTGPRVLDFKTIEKKLPWGVIILVGGGFALAQGSKDSGLSMLMGQKLTALSVLSPAAMITVICFVTAMVTEVMSNTTAATIILPIISQMAKTMGINPLYFMLPVTVTCSFAFMFPVATPPNAIAYDGGNMKMLDMIKPGSVMNVACCCIQLFMLHTLGTYMFSLDKFPQWANSTLPHNLTDH